MTRTDLPIIFILLAFMPPAQYDILLLIIIVITVEEIFIIGLIDRELVCGRSCEFFTERHIYSKR